MKKDDIDNKIKIIKNQTPEERSEEIIEQASQRNKDEINLKDLMKATSEKILNQKKIMAGRASVGDITVSFQYKPLTKKVFMNAQKVAEKGLEKMQDHILRNCLWDEEQERLCTLKEINNGLSIVWQSAIMTTIISDSGLVVNEKDIKFLKKGA